MESDGDNVVFGRLINILPYNSWLVESSSTVSVDARHAQMMLIRPRYVGESLATVIGDQSMAVNVALVDGDTENVHEQASGKQPQFVIVGSVRLRGTAP
jgi:hypothetical protein